MIPHATHIKAHILPRVLIGHLPVLGVDSIPDEPQNKKEGKFREHICCLSDICSPGTRQSNIARRCRTLGDLAHWLDRAFASRKTDKV